MECDVLPWGCPVEHSALLWLSSVMSCLHSISPSSAALCVLAPCVLSCTYPLIAGDGHARGLELAVALQLFGLRMEVSAEL